MKSGNSWVPLNKGLKAFLPKDKRPFTKLEASFSLQLDYDEGTGATVSGYASLWGWNRKKVLKFLDDAGVSIKGSARGSHKGGTIKPQGHEGLHERDMRGTSQGHLKLIDNKHLENEKDMRGTSQGHERDMRGVTTIKTNTKTKTKKKSKPSLSKASPLDLELAKYLAEKIKAHSENAKCNVKSWAEDIRKMRTIDKRQENEIRRVIDFATTDSFWHTNILSAGKLRDKFDQLKLKLNSNGGGKTRMGETVDALQEFIRRKQNERGTIQQRDCNAPGSLPAK